LVFGTDLWIEVTGVSLAEQATTLTVIKEVIKDDGGDAVVADFNLFVEGNPVTSGVPVPLVPGSYTVSESGVSGYEATLSGNCDELGEVTLNEGDNLTCTITNDDIAPNITLVKEEDGPLAPADFAMYVNGGAPIPSGNSKVVLANTDLFITEDPETDYVFVGIAGAGCPAALATAFQLSEGQSVTCTITNEFTAD